MAIKSIRLPEGDRLILFPFFKGKLPGYVHPDKLLAQKRKLREGRREVKEIRSPKGLSYNVFVKRIIWEDDVNKTNEARILCRLLASKIKTEEPLALLLLKKPGFFIPKAMARNESNLLVPYAGYLVTKKVPGRAATERETQQLRKKFFEKISAAGITAGDIKSINIIKTRSKKRSEKFALIDVEQFRINK